jgi:Uma2 family endonuclease
MATTTNQLSWEAFEQLPDGDGMHRELIDGELQILPPPKSRHTEVAKRVFLALVAIETPSGCRAYTEAGYKLTERPPSWLQPDASFLSARRAAAADPDGFFLGAPELAVEVISPSESAADVERKVELFLAHGSQIVWVIYPGTQKVHVFLSDGTASIRGIGDSLTLPGILPDWSLPVASLFETE